MKKFLRLAVMALVLLLLASGSAFAAAGMAPGNEREEDIVKAVRLYCLPPVIGRGSVAEHAIESKLPEFPPEQARVFSKQGGRVFGIPAAKGDAVLIALSDPGPMCEILIRVARPDKFWEALGKHFGPERAFNVISEKTEPDGRVEKQFSANFDGDVALFVTLRDQPQKGGVQGVISFSRVKEVPRQKEKAE